MEGCINTFKVFSMCCQTAFQKASYSGWTGCSSVLNQSTRLVLTTECYPFDTVFAKSGEKHGFSLVLTTFLLRVPRLCCPSSPRAVSRDFPNTDMFILAAFLLPLPKLACLNYVLKWYQKRGSEIEHPPSSIREWLGCAWHHNENSHCGHSLQPDQSAGMQSGASHQPHPRGSTGLGLHREAKGALGGKS